MHGILLIYVKGNTSSSRWISTEHIHIPFLIYPCRRNESSIGNIAKIIKAMLTLKFTILSNGNVVYCSTIYSLQIDFKVCFKYIVVLLACSLRGVCLTKWNIVIKNAIRNAMFEKPLPYCHS